VTLLFVEKEINALNCIVFSHRYFHIVYSSTVSWDYD